MNIYFHDYLRKNLYMCIHLCPSARYLAKRQFSDLSSFAICFKNVTEPEKFYIGFILYFPLPFLASVLSLLLMHVKWAETGQAYLSTGIQFIKSQA